MNPFFLGGGGEGSSDTSTSSNVIYLHYWYRDSVGMVVGRLLRTPVTKRFTFELHAEYVEMWLEGHDISSEPSALCMIYNQALSIYGLLLVPMSRLTLLQSPHCH